MDIFFSIIGFLLISFFWILSFIILYKQKGGILYFVKHLFFALSLCFTFSIFIISIAFSQKIGLEIIAYIFGIGLLDVILYFIWSFFLFTKALNRKKDPSLSKQEDGYEDILDDG